MYLFSSRCSFIQQDNAAGLHIRLLRIIKSLQKRKTKNEKHKKQFSISTTDGNKIDNRKKTE